MQNPAYSSLRHRKRMLGLQIARFVPRPPPPCASMAVVPKVKAKQRFNAHPVLRQARACARHTQQHSTVHDSSHAGNSNVSRGRTSHQNKQHRVAMRGTTVL